VTRSETADFLGCCLSPATPVELFLSPGRGYISLFFQLTSQRRNLLSEKTRKEAKIAPLCARMEYLDNYAGDSRQCTLLLLPLLLRVRANKCTIFIATSQSGIMRALNNGQALQNNSRCRETTRATILVNKTRGRYRLLAASHDSGERDTERDSRSVHRSPRIGIRQVDPIIFSRRCARVAHRFVDTREIKRERRLRCSASICFGSRDADTIYARKVLFPFYLRPARLTIVVP